MKKIIQVKPHYRTILNHLSFRMLYGRIVKEQQYLSSFYYNLKAVGWDDFTFFPDGFAANASLLYLLFKILHKTKPKTILELGSGQSTKLTTRYVKEHEKSEITIIEDCEEWFEKIKSDIFSSKRSRLICSPLEQTKIGRRKCLWYSTKVLTEEDTTYELILVDGPFGTRRFSRVGIANFLPKIIDKNNFILVFDDAARIGELDTIRMIKKIFRKEGIHYLVFHVYGSKKQTCFISPNLSFLGTN
ncbi:MAG: hypothetical protein KGD59_00160 [Candidatus Heimdallarchaeota archaeon]|nr:hypothetical protein [Candidatus Heimdallarchaeota archaeon]MBY8992934.1 hypothetical protein [Candidatus Heimdallarchaeota archaeon]